MTLTPNFIGGADGRELYMNGGRCFNDSHAIRAFHSIEEIMPYMSADFTTVSSYTSKQRFINQKAAMLFGGSWDLRYFLENAKFDWGVFASPAPSGSQTTVIFQPDIGIGINNQVSSAHQKAALRFLEWLMTEKGLNLTNEILPGFFPLSNTQTQPSNNSHSAEFQQLIKGLSHRFALGILGAICHEPGAPRLRPDPKRTIWHCHQKTYHTGSRKPISSWNGRMV